MGRRTLLLITSILIAAVGTALIGLYVRDADSRALKTEGAVSTLVADQTIPAGTTLEAALSLMRPDEVPARMATLGYTGSNAKAKARKALKGQVVTEPINDEQVVLKSMFSTPGDAATTEITKGRGVTVQLSDPARAAGLLVPGSEVTIYLNPLETDTKLKDVQKLAKHGRQLTLDPPITLPVIVEKARVMRIGNSTDQPVATPRTTASQRDDVPRTIVTLDLPPADAAAIVAAQALGDLYFAVHGPST
jgi:pilus assembly protein CpaB